MQKQKLRVGLVLDCLDVPAWVYRLIERIQDSQYARVELLLVHGGRTDTITTPGKHSIGIQRSIRKLLLWIQEIWLERVSFHPNALERKDLSQLLGPIASKDLTSYVCGGDVKTLRSFQLDVVVQFSGGRLPEKIFDCATYGVWSYNHAAPLANTEDVFGFWEVMKGYPETQSILHARTGSLAPERILSQSFTCAHEFSVQATRNRAYWKSAAFVPRQLEAIHIGGEKKFFETVQCNSLISDSSPQLPTIRPTNYEFSTLLLRKTYQKIENSFLSRFYMKQWCLFYRLDVERGDSFSSFQRLLPPKDRFWADPHIIYKDHTYYIFFEEFIYTSRKGHIAVIVMDEDGHVQATVPILEKPYHLSYPFVFAWRDSFYMIPESQENQTIALYKCVGFPDRWEFQMNLMEDVTAADSTLVRAQGKWWLFTTIAEEQGASLWDELFVFSSDELVSTQWTPHSLNPVISDVKRARPAGRIFKRNGKMYRPSQNCSHRYGYGFHINEITVLNDTDYQEKIITSVEPGWDKDVLATHTFNQAHRLTMIDAQILRRR